MNSGNMKTVDEISASVDVTLSNWRSAFDEERAGDATVTTTTTNSKIKSTQIWKDSDEYNKRLCTYKPESYFAKPLAISPLVCAAFGWENSSRDIIQCTQCGGTICVAFHPSLNEESRTNVCQKYMEMLVTSHCNTCPFRSYAARWSKVMQHKQQTCEEGDGDNSTHSQSGATKTISENNDASNRLNKVSEALLGNSKTNFYVPPYLLPLSNDLLRFEDCTEDGSITRDNIKEGALKIHDKLQTMDIGGSSKLRELMVPEIVTKYCNEKFPWIDLDDVLCQKNITMKTPYLLSTFGWSICDNDDEPETLDERKNKDAVVVKCNICQARATLLMQHTEADNEEDGEGSRKRRRTDSIQDGIKLKLLDSHRGYCPYVAGFSYGPRKQSEEGWKVVLSCLKKQYTTVK